MKTCKGCEHYAADEGKEPTGHCRERVFSQMQGTSYFPPVKATWWCGKFKPKKTK